MSKEPSLAGTIIPVIVTAQTTVCWFDYTIMKNEENTFVSSYYQKKPMGNMPPFPILVILLLVQFYRVNWSASVKCAGRQSDYWSILGCSMCVVLLYLRHC